MDYYIKRTGKVLTFDMETSTVTFDALWNEMHDRLCRFVCRRVSNDQDAEDILQDIFIRIYRKLGTVREPKWLEPWMYQIARNRIIDHYRSRQQWTDLSEILAVNEDEDEAMDSLLAYLQESVRGLPDPYREALILAEFQGMAQQDLAGKFGITLSGAKSRVQRARQKVKEAIFHCFDFEFDTRGRIMDYRQRCCCQA